MNVCLSGHSGARLARLLDLGAGHSQKYKCRAIKETVCNRTLVMIFTVGLTEAYIPHGFWESTKNISYLPDE